MGGGKSWRTLCFYAFIWAFSFPYFSTVWFMWLIFSMWKCSAYQLWKKTHLYWREHTFGYQKQPPEVFCKKGVLRNFAKYTGKQLCQRLFFDKVAGLRPVTLLKKSLRHKCFPVNFAKFPRTPFLQNTSGRLFLVYLRFFANFRENNGYLIGLNSLKVLEVKFRCSHLLLWTYVVFFPEK